MADTPKIPKKHGRHSLSLNSRLNRRLSSPKVAEDVDKSMEIQSSARVDSKEFTPPSKKLNLDDSLDDSPLSFTNSFSPTMFLSETQEDLDLDVTWQWKFDGYLKEPVKTARISEDQKKENYARIALNRQEYYKKREERRRAKIAKIRKAERERVEAVLRERLSALESRFKGFHATEEQEQLTADKREDLEEDGEKDFQEVAEKSPKSSKSPIEAAEYAFDDIDDIFEDSNIDFDEAKPMSSSDTNDKRAVSSLDEFFDDSDTDDLLLAATQQIESKMPELTQTLLLTPNKVKSPEKPKENEKRSSLYMKFLEDDEDDFFVSLDDAWLLQATQSTKPRSPFQRYKSMPTSTTTTTTDSSKTSSAVESSRGNTYNASSSSTSVKAIKRHASSHAMSPSTTKYRGRQLPSRD